MQIKRPPFVVIVLAVLILLAGGYYLYNATLPANSALTASGTVEATEILIAPELSGKVTEVLVNQGDMVKAGDVLFRLDDTLPQAQRSVTAAGLDTAKAASLTADAAAASAQAQYDLVLNAALAEQKSNRTADWTDTLPTEFNQPIWYFAKPEQVAAAQAEVDTAKSALDTTQSKLSAAIEKAASEEFINAEKRLLNARATFQVAQDVLDGTNSADQSLRDSAQQAYDDASSELTNAQTAYDDTVTTSGAEDVLIARADLSVAQERYDMAQDRLHALQTG
ncbi:MAG: biotin/lipoyl-binding protein, partial [Anaerolineales bacterium]|nr:biotin/lipoyl-binding protein [Anaerolineales bacterium]